MTRLEKNGGVPGGYGWMIHLLPATMTGINKHDSFSLAIGLSRKVEPLTEQLDGLVTIAGNIERAGAWPPGDRFDDL